MSGDPDQEYFSDGISEDIITDLSKVSGLLVIARNSSFAYKGKSVDLRTVGRELGVGFLLEGSVRRAGNRVRITAQLIDAATGGHLWADRYDRELTDIFAVQDEVTLDIVTALKVKLSPQERVNLSRVGTADMEAHDNFLRMRSILFWPGINAALWKRGVAFGRRAIELDPQYTHAHAILAIVLLYDLHHRWSGVEPDEVLARARRQAERAMELDPNDYLANHAVAVVERWAGNYGQSAAALGKTMSLVPDYALGLFTRSELSIAAGRPEEAIPDLERAMRLDPGFGHQYLQYLGMAHFLLGNYETAALVFRERVLLVQDTDFGRAWLAATLGHLGEVAEARQAWADLVKISPEFSLEQRLARQKFADATYVARVMDGLAKAGLPR
jgi:adenylate cyclase